MRLVKFINTRKLKKQLLKQGAALGVMSLLAVACSGTTIMAKPTESGSLNGHSCYGSIDTDRDNAYGTTSCGRGNVRMTVTAKVYYWSNETCFRSEATGSSTNGGTSATAKKKIGGADVIGGKGIHSVSFDAYSWGPVETTTGTIPPKSTLK